MIHRRKSGEIHILPAQPAICAVRDTVNDNSIQEYPKTAQINLQFCELVEPQCWPSLSRISKTGDVEICAHSVAKSWNVCNWNLKNDYFIPKTCFEKTKLVQFACEVELPLM